MNSAFVDFVTNLACHKPETTVADVLDRIMLERQAIHIEGVDAFTPEELNQIERHWRILIRHFNWSPEMLLEKALTERTEVKRKGKRDCE